VPPDASFVGGALEQLAARGPDGRATVERSYATLGVTRLAISGLIGGDQPLVSPDGTVRTVFNGAIYNSLRLLEELGAEPPSSNDGEVIPLLYQLHGLAFADHLEGMYAILLVDDDRRRVVAAVDPVGIKPLYWAAVEGLTYFASTIAGFPSDLLPHVRRFPPGTVWDSSSGVSRRIVPSPPRGSDLLELVRSSVAEQIPQEVNWGCMLSGGVDSSLIAALASQEVGRIKTYSLGFEGSSDVQNAAEVAQLIDSEHHVVTVGTEELANLVDHVIALTASMERWTVTAGVATYLVARQARADGLKVLLSGEGADELFAGYDEFQGLQPTELRPVLNQYLADLGATECLRLDRCTMAVGLEARVPYLAHPLVAYARTLTDGDLISRPPDQPERKIALRRCALDVVGPTVAYRTKEEFANGSGITSAIVRLAEREMPVSEALSIQRAFPSFPIDGILDAWLLRKWLVRYGMTVGFDWNKLVHRGLFRQTVSGYLAS
jgi:asparagine synthase (glutamine-hydrolysing)